jgi:hypothetical protein
MQHSHFQESDSSSGVKKLSAYCEAQRFITVSKSPSLTSNLSHMNPINALPFCLFHIGLIFICLFPYYKASNKALTLEKLSPISCHL